MIKINGKNMNGTYTIGVFGKSNCTYAVTAAARKNKIIFIEPGVPLNLEV